MESIVTEHFVDVKLLDRMNKQFKHLRRVQKLKQFKRDPESIEQTTAVSAADEFIDQRDPFLCSKYISHRKIAAQDHGPSFLHRAEMAADERAYKEQITSSNVTTQQIIQMLI